MKNEYEVRGDVTAVIINSPKYGRLETLISTAHLEKVKEFQNTWDVRKDAVTNYYYVGGFLPRNLEKRRYILLHRFVTDAPKGLVVDHINHDTLDNTDNNLRVISQIQNSQNRRKENKNSTSGILGVYWDKKYNYWYVRIRFNGKYMYVGSYKKIEDAERAVREARIKYMPYSKEAIGI